MKYMYGSDGRRNLSFGVINVGVRKIRFQGEPGVVIIPVYMDCVPFFGHLFFRNLSTVKKRAGL